MRGKKSPDADIPLGLAVISAMIHEGKLETPLPLPVIAAACGCSPQQIANIEQKALRKLRNLHLAGHGGLQELFENYSPPRKLETPAGRRNGFLWASIATVPDNPPEDGRCGNKPPVVRFSEIIESELCATQM